MKRSQIIDNLIKEGFSEKTLVRFSDKQLSDLHQRIISESDVMISKQDPNLQQKVADAKKSKKSIETYEEEKPSAGLSKKKKSEIVKKAKKGEDIGKRGKEFEKIEKKAKESGADNPKAVAAAQMWKNVKKENVEVKNWIKTLAENNFHSFTSKGEIMELIQSKSSGVEFGSKVKKGHNGVPEFMTYDSIVTAAEPKEKPQTRPTETPTKDPGTKQPPKKDPRKTPFQPGPGPNPKPKALKETK
jgi:phenylalanyl-tRNA synthetase alpha subunit